MNILLADLKRSVSAVPTAQLSALLGVLATMTAEVQMRMLTGPAPVTPAPEDLLTVRDVAKRLNMSAYRVYELCRTGLLKADKCGKSVRVTPSAVAEYLAKQGA